MKYRCKVCGWVSEDVSAKPEKCPICGAKAESLEEVVEGKKTYATEHKIGDGIVEDKEIVEGLRANFNGECIEVGMYLAMSRVAEREGYPEIAMLFEQIAKEEAEHAAKFAEFLGEVVVADTKANIEKIGTCQVSIEGNKPSDEDYEDI